MASKRRPNAKVKTDSATRVGVVPRRGRKKLVRTRYDLDDLVRLVVTDVRLEPPLEARRDRLARAFGVDLEALRAGRNAVERVLAGRNLEAEAERLLALPELAREGSHRREILRDGLDRDGVAPSFESLLDIARDCIEGGPSGRAGPFRMVWLEGTPPLAEYVVHHRHQRAVSEAREAVLRATRATLRSCVELLYPHASGVGTVELAEEPYDPHDWF
ncbi:MAG: hypothetical protein OHK0013_50060 [Sandaracinaceae bacterium]